MTVETVGEGSSRPAGPGRSAVEARVLYLSTVQPLARRTGGEICTMNFVDALKAAGATVELVAYQRADDAGELPGGFVSPRRLTIESAGSRSKTALWLGTAFAANRPFSVQKFVTGAMRSLVAQKLSNERYDLVVVDHAQVSWLLDLVPRETKTVLVAHNVEHALYRQNAAELKRKRGWLSPLKAAVFSREARLIRALEKRAIERCDEVWTLSGDDAAAFSEIVAGRSPRPKIRVFSVPGQTFADPAGGNRPEPSIDVGLLGSWNWDINRDGLNWFLAEVAPRLPDLEIVVAGKSDRRPGTCERNVRFAGFVESAGDFLRACRVVAIPSTIGSGIQIKTIETIGIGAPVVSTPIGLRGISDRPPHVIEASDAASMAAAIRRLVEDPPAGTTDGSAWWHARKTQFEGGIAAALRALTVR